MAMEPTDRKQRIGQLVPVKERIAELDTKGLRPYRVPAAAATSAKLEVVEAHIGEALGPRLP